mgnify:CR=1 FL=1
MKPESKSRMINVLKTTSRILIILLAVGLVAGGLYWIGQNRPSLLGLSDSPSRLLEEVTRTGRGARELFGDADARDNQLPLDFEWFEMSHHGVEGGLDASRTWVGILRNMLIITAITLLVVGIHKLYAWIFRRRRERAV